MFIPDEIHEDDELAGAVGKQVASVLRLKKTRSGGAPSPLRYETAWGTKSDAGLCRVVVRVIAEELLKRDQREAKGQP